MTQHHFPPMIFKASTLTIILFGIIGSVGFAPVSAAATIKTNIRLQPAQFIHILHDKYYVPANVNLSAEAEILSEAYKNSNLTYQWTTNQGTIITSTNASHIHYIFKKPDENNFLKVLVVETNNVNNTGSSQKELAIRNPIEVANPSGKLFIQHGELLDIILRYSGTGPFKYCYRICTEAYKVDCDNCEVFMNTISSEVAIQRYLRFVANYTLLFKINNLASESLKRYSVRVEDSFRSQKVPYVPIVSSITAVLILFSGVALHMKFRKTVDIETADFEFLEIAQDEDELLEGETFYQRVINLLRRPSTYIP